MAETESYKLERERERTKGSTAHCPVLEKATGSGPNAVFLKAQTPSDQKTTAKNIFAMPHDQI